MHLMLYEEHLIHVQAWSGQIEEKELYKTTQWLQKDL